MTSNQKCHGFEGASFPNCKSITKFSINTGFLKWEKSDNNAPKCHGFESICSF